MQSVFLQGQYPNNIWSIPWKVAPCPLKDYHVHFHISFLSFKGAVPLLEKSIFLHNICSIIDIVHLIQKCNMIETVSIIKECSLVSYNTILSCMAAQFSKQHSWKIRLITSLPLGQITAQPSFRQLSLQENAFNTIQQNCIRFINILSHSYQGDVAQDKTTDSSRTTIFFQKSATCIQYTICSNNVCLSYCRIQRWTFFKLQYFLRGELHTLKGVICKIWFVVLE